MKELNKSIEERNKLDAKLFATKNNFNINNEMLLAETMNLLDGVGEGFVAGDDYAPDRYYSKIDGVKNIRIIPGDFVDKILVKVTDYRGWELYDLLEVRGKEYEIGFIRAKSYDYKSDLIF